MWLKLLLLSSFKLMLQFFISVFQLKCGIKIILLLTVVSKQPRFILSSNEASSALVRPVSCVRATN